MGKIHTLECPEEKTILLCGDLHSYHLHLPSFKAMLKYSRYLDDPWIVINGDLFDFAFFMSKNEGFKKWIKREDGIDEFFLPEYEKECAVVSSILDRLQAHFSKIIWVGGNHDDIRIEKFVPLCPFQYRPHFDFIKTLRLQDRGIPYIRYGDWLDVGEDVSITHSNWHNTTCLKKNFDACGKNVIISHVHRYQVMPFVTRGVTKYATSLPAMCNLDMHYLRNGETNWSNGFGELNIHKNHHALNVYLWKDRRMILPRGVSLDEDKI